jgi:hypothetical protein
VFFFKTISPFAEIFKKEDRFFACGMHANIAPQQQAASSSHRGTSTPLAPQQPLFSRVKINKN